MGKFEMPVMEEKTMGDLEEGLLLHGTWGPQLETAIPAERKARRAVYYKIMFYSALLVLVCYHQLAYARPAATTTQVTGLPQYVLDYAPIVYLDTAEAYFPADMNAQIANTHPTVNLTSIPNPPSPLSVHNLDTLNTFGNNGLNVFLTSNLDVTKTPNWLLGVVPDSTGKTSNASSCAIITTDHGNGLVDAFYMYFYAYNQGNTVLSHELGDHIGDWEHNMVRFQDGKPQAVWYSQHGNGEAFTYAAVEKNGIRPVSYSAKGSHGNYAIVGKHDHTIPDLNLPEGLIVDYTSKGMKWDPTLNAYFYTFDPSSTKFTGLNNSPVGAMAYKGKWGDDQYLDSDPRQPGSFFGFKKFVAGPTGPGDKQLNRKREVLKIAFSVLSWKRWEEWKVGADV
ncbi:hypothetical protein G7Y89_g13153 [Cudoniella acicularis]|uniref:Vacuolar protein sorting-associated protein 62 n=1 Tax=Cudoniella acicularis TaxID=354080 RepID=A0A8H4VWC0_9HELO|nr:hypothetical protein G7Y89_g13153 [Cudoniella acicularis]